MTDGTTLTSRILIGAVVYSSTEDDYIVITITKPNHGIAVKTSVKVNISGLDFYTANLANGTKAQDFYNGDKIFIATTTDNLIYKVQLRVFPALLGLIGGTPVVNIDNAIWQLEPGRYKIQTINSADVNWNGNKIKIFADYYNGSVSPSYFYTEQNNIDNGEYGIAGATLTFDGYVKKGNIALQTINALTNIPLLIYKL
jgi:hypothetical protein